jgi:large subunit ribosomal protein L9
VPTAILLEDVAQRGPTGAVVDVAKGYLRNYLIPRRLAQPATKGALEQVQRRMEAEEKAARDAAAAAADHAAVLNKTVLTIGQQAGDDGRLFGSVTAQDIADAIKDARGVSVDRRRIHLEAPIKSVGTHMVVVEVAEGVTATVKTIVTEQ